MDRLLKLGAKTDVLDARGRGLLLAAVVQRRGDWVDRLLEAGADPQVRDEGGHSPLHYAVLGEDTGMIQRLIGRTGNCMEPCCEGMDLLDHALERGGAPVLDAVLEGVPIQETGDRWPWRRCFGPWRMARKAGSVFCSAAMRRCRCLRSGGSR